MSDGSPRKIDYAVPPPWHRRLVAQRTLIAIAILLAAVLCWRAWPIVSRQIAVVRLQSACMDYVPTAGAVAHFVPKPWDDLYAIISPPGLQSSGTVFLHSRSTPDGEECLVAIDSTWIPSSATPTIYFSARVFEPGSLFRMPIEIQATGDGCKMAMPRGAEVLAGQIDPKDESHFTFELRVPRKDEPADVATIDGWLTKNGVVLIQPRVTPASRPASLQPLGIP